MELEDLIKEMGYVFRDLTYHSNGRYSCRLGGEYKNKITGWKEFWGETPLEAVKYAFDVYKHYDKEHEIA